MSQITVQAFLNHLRKSSLLPGAQLNLLQDKVSGKALTAIELSEFLVNQNQITTWQARQLLKGETGFILDHYQLLNPIGRGGMGHVFRGMDSRTQEIVAVKVMAKKLTSNKTLVSRFRREIRASSQLNSPHIVRSLDAGRVGKVDFMVMEFVNGDQIDRVANVLQRVPTGLACEIVRQAAVGLQHAHENGMVHRDIKPANLMVNWTESGEGIVKLMDMGLVLLKDDDTNENTVTRAGQVMGTPDFMSPEQGWDTASVDIRSDIYALGCTLYRLLTGTIPFSGTNPLQVLSQRLQRDAPSVRTICSDIPEEVAEIVSRMTLRDPTARYQHPAEVADALATVSEPLTRQALKTVARKVTNDADAHVDFGKDTDDEVDESDGTYRQFLKEVQEGSAVNFMLGTASSGSPAAETIPAIDLNISTTSSTRVSMPRRGQKAGFLVMGVALLALMGLLIFVFNKDSGTAAPAVTKVIPVEPILPTATISESRVEQAITGEQWTHNVEAQISESSGKAGYRLGSSAPPGMTISPSGNIKWDVPLEQTPAVYEIDVILTWESSGVTHDLRSTSLPVKVVPGFATITLPEAKSQTVIPPEQEFSVSAATESEHADLFDLKYQLVGKYPSNLLLNADTGLISWTPTINEIGRHQITIAVFDSANPDQQQTSTYRVLVRPTKIEHALPEIPVQNAKAGETFRMELPRPSFMRLQKILNARRVVPGPGAPEGLTINPETDEVVWAIPSNVSGKILVPLLCRIVSPDDDQLYPLAGQAQLTIDVTATSATTSAVNMPAAEDIEAAVEELRKSLSRSISLARTSASKAELARQLLEHSLSGEAGVSDAALLSLIETELATKSKATNVLLQIAVIRDQRYGVDPTDAISQTLASVKRTSLSPMQQDLTVEHCLQLAESYAEAKNFELTEQLLEAVSTVLGRSASGVAKDLENDVEKALGFAKNLVADADSATNTVYLGELTSALRRWQFLPAFTESPRFDFIQLSAEGSVPSLADNGRSAWTAKQTKILLAAESAPVDVGIVWPTQADRFVVRFELLPDSNCAHFLFGVSGATDQEFKAFRLVLNEAETGAIQSLRPRGTVAKVGVKPRLFDDQSNLVELLVDGQQVSTRINGVLVSQAEVPGLTAGRIGFLADLRVPSPKVSIRNPRILKLPDPK